MTNRRLVAASAALLLALVFFVLHGKSIHAQAPSCGLLQDCTMDGFYGDSGAGSGVWKIFKGSGGVSIGLHENEGWPKGPSVWLQSGNSPFDAGIYQQVTVTPGKGYRFSIPFAVISLDGEGWHEGDQVNRRLGIDPFGGTDPNSSNVQWSPDFFGKGRFEDDELQVSAYAQSSTMTAFIRVINPYSDKHVDVYLDTPNLDVNTGMTPIQVSPPTATRPPTSAPTRIPPTAPPTRAPTTTLQPTIEVIPTGTLVTVAATDTPAPTDTSAPTATRRTSRAPAASLTPSLDIQENVSPIALGVLGAIGIMGMLSAAVLFGLAIFYWRRGAASH